MRDIDVIYPIHNRLFYTSMTLPVVMAECRRSARFHKLFIVDDDSTDGTEGLAKDLINLNRDMDIEYVHHQQGNSTFCINYVQSHSETPYLVKIDNDILIPDRYLDHMAGFMDGNEEYGFLMAGEVCEFPHIDHQNLKITQRSHIGGVGIFRKKCWYKPNGQRKGFMGADKRFFGFTKFQDNCLKEGWKAGQVNGASMTLLDCSKAYSRVKMYMSAGYGRELIKSESIFEPKKDEKPN